MLNWRRSTAPIVHWLDGEAERCTSVSPEADRSNRAGGDRRICYRRPSPAGSSRYFVSLVFVTVTETCTGPMPMVTV